MEVGTCFGNQLGTTNICLCWDVEEEPLLLPIRLLMFSTKNCWVIMSTVNVCIYEGAREVTSTNAINDVSSLGL